MYLFFVVMKVSDDLSDLQQAAQEILGLVQAGWFPRWSHAIPPFKCRLSLGLV